MTTINKILLAAFLPGLVICASVHAVEEPPKTEITSRDPATQPPAAPAGKQPPSSPVSVESARKPAKPHSMIDYCRENTC